MMSVSASSVKDDRSLRNKLSMLNLDESSAGVAAGAIAAPNQALFLGSEQQPMMYAVRKRRHKQIDNDWEFKLDGGSQSVIATQSEDQMSDQLSTNSSSRRKRRQLKLQAKTITKIC